MVLFRTAEEGVVSNGVSGRELDSVQFNFNVCGGVSLWLLQRVQQSLERAGAL